MLHRAQTSGRVSQNYVQIFCPDLWFWGPEEQKIYEQYFLDSHFYESETMFKSKKNHFSTQRGQIQRVGKVLTPSSIPLYFDTEQHF